MKRTTLCLFILLFVTSTGFAKRIVLNKGYEFEYRISSYYDSEEEVKLNQFKLFESYNLESYQFKVLEITEDGYALVCNYEKRIIYSRQKPRGKSQWQTLLNRNMELHNKETSNDGLVDCEFRLTLSHEGEVGNLSMVGYAKEVKDRKYLTEEKDILDQHRKNLLSYFFKIPKSIKPGDTITNANASYLLDSEDGESIYFTSNVNDDVEYTTLRNVYPETEIVETSYKGNRNGKMTLIIDKVNGLVKELCASHTINTIINGNSLLSNIINENTRGVFMSDTKEGFDCVYVSDGKRDTTVLYNTNVRIRGKITNPHENRIVQLQWFKREPSAYIRMGIEVPLNDDNTFEFRLQVDKLEKIIFLHYEKSEFYIMPGDDFTLSVDLNSFDETIKAKGVGAHHVNFSFEKFLFDEKNDTNLGTVGRKLYLLEQTATPQEYKDYAYSRLKIMQQYALSNRQLVSPEVFLANYWNNQCLVDQGIRNYANHVNRIRELKGLQPYCFDYYTYVDSDSLIHADNDLMMFADDYDSFIRGLVFFYLRDQLTSIIGRGNVIYVNNFYDNDCNSNYNFAEMFFTGKTQESLKYSTVNDAMTQASWNTYERLLQNYLEQFPNSSRREVLKDAYEKSKKVSPLSTAYNFSLKDLEGKTHHLSDYKGKAVYLSFWSLGVGTDGGVQKNLNKLQDAFRDSNIVFIQVLFNGNEEQAKEYITEYDQNGIFLLANKSAEDVISREYFFNSIPHFCIIDTNGKIVSNKNNFPYEILREPQLLDDALIPKRLSINYQQRSELMTSISFGLLALLVLAVVLFLWHKQRNFRKLKLVDLNQQLRESELKAIRAQMNPHFMHNCLNAIQNLVQKMELEKAHQYISKFAMLIRDTLILSEKEEISLSQEIEMVNNYVSLEQLRFKLDYQVSIASEVDIYSILIPPMLLQPIMENAIIHGLSNKRGDKKLSLSISQRKELVVIEIVDNGIGRRVNIDKTRNGTGKGTLFTKERLALLRKKYGTVCKMTINDQYDDNKLATGTKVEIIIEDEA